MTTQGDSTCGGCVAGVNPWHHHDAQQDFRREYDSTPCSRCGRVVRVRRDGSLAKHIALTGKEPCE